MTSRPHVAFLTYNGLREPLGLRQGLAYLEPLTDAFDLTVVSWEKDGPTPEPDPDEPTARRVRRSGIEWIPLRYHRTPSLAATAWDVAAGARVLGALQRRRSLSLLHARGYVPAAVAWWASRRVGVPYLFDIRGLLADEYVDGGVWTRGSLPWRATRRAERLLLRDAGGLVTLTEAVRPEVERRRREAGGPAQPPPWEVIPCCVDLEEFRPDPAARMRVRRALELGDGPVAVYAGSTGTWYPSRPLGLFLEALRRRVPHLTVLLLLNDPTSTLPAQLAAQGLPPEAIRTVSVRPEEVPAHLAAADLGLALVAPSPSKVASSPTKVAEYLACGLPLVATRGVGDLHRLAEEEAVVLARSLEPPALEEAARGAARLLGTSPEGPRALAGRAFDLHGVAVPRYRRLYEALTVDGEP